MKRGDQHLINYGVDPLDRAAQTAVTATSSLCVVLRPSDPAPLTPDEVSDTADQMGTVVLNVTMVIERLQDAAVDPAAKAALADAVESLDRASKALCRAR